MVSCVHHIPGRARFKLEVLRRDPDLAVMLEQQVSALDGVSLVEVNRFAGSITVHYSIGVGSIEQIMDHICVHCPHAPANRRAAPAAAAAAPRAGSSKMAQAMREAASKAVINTLINRAVEQSLSGLVRMR